MVEVVITDQCAISVPWRTIASICRGRLKSMECSVERDLVLENYQNNWV